MAEVIANGGSSPYTYQWNDLSNTTNAKVNNLAPGTYMVTVMDAKGCTAVGIVEIDASLEECDCLIRKGDFVWYDFDKDGIQDANELGVNGIPVHLVESGPDGEYGTEDDIKIKSTITSGSGLIRDITCLKTFVRGLMPFVLRLTQRYIFFARSPGT